MTPSMSFIASQRDTCRTIGIDTSGTGPVPRRSTRWVTAPVDPEVGDDAAFAHDLGEVLWAVVDRARRLGVDPEDALRAATVAHLADLRTREV